jgi:carbon monoxide dehydrogenase subunit G
MEFSGTFELEHATVDEVWLALSDPVLIADALPGCEFLLRVDDPEDVDFDELAERAEAESAELSGDPEVIAERAFQEGETYAALVGLSVGPVNPTFETVVTIIEREGRRMRAEGEGTSGDSTFEMSSWMELEQDGDDVAVEWHTEADVFGRIANMGQRVINPVANRVVKRFFSSVEDRLHDLSVDDVDEAGEAEDRGLLDRVLGRSKSNDSQ